MPCIAAIAPAVLYGGCAFRHHPPAFALFFGREGFHALA